MRRLMILGSIAVVLLLSALISPEAKAGVLAGQNAGVRSTVLAPSGKMSGIDLQQLKDQVRKTLGQSVVNRMLYPITQPSSSHRHTQSNSRVSLRNNTASPKQAANASGNSYGFAGYIADLRSQTQTLTGVVGQFNAAPVSVPPSVPLATQVGLGYFNGAPPTVAPILITAGVDQGSMYAYYDLNGLTNYVFHVSAADQMSAEIYQWDVNVWLIFISDQKTGQYFFQLVNYTAPLPITMPVWGIEMLGVGPIASFFPVGFSQTQWISTGSSGWQPIVAAPAYYAISAYATPGIIWSTDITNNTFVLLNCPSC